MRSSRRLAVRNRPRRLRFGSSARPPSAIAGPRNNPRAMPARGLDLCNSREANCEFARVTQGARRVGLEVLMWRMKRAVSNHYILSRRRSIVRVTAFVLRRSAVVARTVRPALYVVARTRAPPQDKCWQDPQPRTLTASCPRPPAQKPRAAQPCAAHPQRSVTAKRSRAALPGVPQVDVQRQSVTAMESLQPDVVAA